jgi:acetylornithine/succinyldiaminopimelate/putrescine aminotransferase
MLKGFRTPYQQDIKASCQKLQRREGVAFCRYIVQTYARPNLVFTHGEGARMYDAHGKEYLDFAAGIAVNALGELGSTSILYLHGTSIGACAAPQQCIA